jgi:ribonuclease HI
MDQEHYFKIKLLVGIGTNNQFELFSMWLPLKVATNKGVNKLQVFGDSKFMVDWANLKCRINNLLLEPLMMQFLQVKESYETLCFSHIYI